MRLGIKALDLLANARAHWQGRLWAPRRLWFRLFTTAGQFVTTGRRCTLR